MKELEKLQSSIRQAELHYKFYLQQFGFSSILTQKAALRMVILMKGEHEYLYPND
ncbi:hypothetical protein [Priestia filamentosa]|uniref:hypothetical protein n=1 Tax=Priestia filamentosa TaxID=1402861 RepID=UPI000A6D761F|nr:hypothetical protein [Priestia filamentosa]